MSEEGREKVVGGPSAEEVTSPFADDDTSSISRREYREGMASVKASLKEMMDMFRSQMLGTPPNATTSTAPIAPTLGAVDITSLSRDGGGGLPPLSTRSGNGSGAHAAFPPPLTYSHGPLPMPHIMSLGPPPILDKDDYPAWVFRMKSHIKSSSAELWRIVEDGYHPYDPRNLTPREAMDDQLNNIALFMIQ